MFTLAHLEEFIQKGCEVTVIQPSAYHYYSGMGPGLLGGTYEPDQLRFNTKKAVEAKGGNFIKEKASYIDTQKQIIRLADSDEEVFYDLLSCNAGSFIPDKISREEVSLLFRVKPIEELYRAREVILQQSKTQKLTITIIGGGPSAVEVAGNIAALCGARGSIQPEIRILAGHNFMPDAPVRVRKLCSDNLQRRGIDIIEQGYVEKVCCGSVHLESGENYRTDIIVMAIGVQPSEIFSRSAIPVGRDGGLLVNQYLQSVAYPNIFGGGDCISFSDKSLDKVGVYAVRQNQIIFKNLMASLEGGALQEFVPQKNYLLIYNLGGGTGVLSKWFLTFSGRLAFMIKDYIDRRFTKTFQPL